MESYIINLFQDMSVLTVVLLGAGVLLCVAEVFVPKVGLMGILGIALLGCGISSYYMDGFSVQQIVVLLSIIALTIALFIFIELILESKGVINNPDSAKFRTYNQEVELDSLVGRLAKAVSNIDLGGTIDIDGKLYYAVSDSPISRGKPVQVIGVKDNALVVKA